MVCKLKAEDAYTCNFNLLFLHVGLHYALNDWGQVM